MTSVTQEKKTAAKLQSCKQPCDQKRMEITADDLPLSCPLPNECLWNAHPRVYLQPDAQGFARCPYCSREFILTDERQNT